MTGKKSTTKTLANKTKQIRKTTKKKLENLPEISELMLHNSELMTVYMSKLYKYTNIGTTLLRMRISKVASQQS